jgi:hypothetical protein
MLRRALDSAQAAAGRPPDPPVIPRPVLGRGICLCAIPRGRVASAKQIPRCPSLSLRAAARDDNEGVSSRGRLTKLSSRGRSARLSSRGRSSADTCTPSGPPPSGRQPAGRDGLRLQRSRNVQVGICLSVVPRGRAARAKQIPRCPSLSLRAAARDDRTSEVATPRPLPPAVIPRPTFGRGICFYALPTGSASRAMQIPRCPSLSLRAGARDDIVRMSSDGRCGILSSRGRSLAEGSACGTWRPTVESRRCDRVARLRPMPCP